MFVELPTHGQCHQDQTINKSDIHGGVLVWMGGVGVLVFHQRIATLCRHSLRAVVSIGCHWSMHLIQCNTSAPEAVVQSIWLSAWQVLNVPSASSAPVAAMSATKATGTSQTHRVRPCAPHPAGPSLGLVKGAARQQPQEHPS